MLLISLHEAIACPSSCSCEENFSLVSCRNLGLESIPLTDIPDPTKVRHFDLHGNSITEVVGLSRLSSLEYLDLSNNQISATEDDAYVGMTNLKYLHLQDNQISMLTQSSLNPLKSLLHLDISHNDISHLDDMTFYNLTNLLRIDLSGNHIESISHDAFFGLASLQHLTLTDNWMSTIAGVLQPLRQLKTLHFARNHITQLPDGFFRHLTSLQKLNLQGNKLEMFTVKSDELPQLVSLDLSFNQLTNIPPSLVNHLPNMEVLNLSNNPLVILETGAISNLTHLQQLYLNYMTKLTVVKTDAITNLPQLQTLEFHSCHNLQTLEVNAFHILPSLVNIDLHSNALDSLDPSLIEFEQLQHLNLHSNPWNCDCNLEWLHDTLHYLHANASVHLVNEIRCSTPERLQDEPLFSLISQDFMCTEDVHQFSVPIMVAIFAVFSSILIVVSAWLVYHSRKSSSCQNQRPGLTAVPVHQSGMMWSFGAPPQVGGERQSSASLQNQSSV